MEYETLEDCFFIVPGIGIQQGTCADPDCQSTHWRLVLVWLWFQIGIGF